MQVVILCGGLGTRLGLLTRQIPKSMVEVRGRPFLMHQLDLLKRRRVNEVILCTGHLSRQISSYFGDGNAIGLKVQYSDEGEQLLGTAGAMKKAEPLLGERFFVMYGDSYLPMDFSGAMDCFDHSGKPAMMVVYRNHNRYDASNVVLENGLIKVYDKSAHDPRMVHIDAGVSIFRKELLSSLPEDTPSSLESLYQALTGERLLAAYETPGRFYEIGSPGGLEEFRKLMASEGLPA